MRDVEQLELVTGIQECCVEAGFGGLGDVFRPSNLLQHYCYTNEPDPASLPPPLRINPFVFRNEDGDYPMPEDERSKHFQAGLVDDYDDMQRTPKKTRRDDELRSGGRPVQTPTSTPVRTPLAPSRGGG